MRFLTKPFAGILAITLLMLFSSCGKETDTPSIKTAGVQIDSIIETEIFVLKVFASVKQDGGDASTQRGICYGTKALPDLTDLVFTDSVKGAGTYSFEVSGLEKSKTYYFRAWAKNAAGLVFGNVLSFTTADIPSITSSDSYEITGATAMTGGNIVSDGGKPITMAGICFDTIQDPDTSRGYQKLQNPASGIFTLKLIDLIPSTTYYYRAFARNDAGIAYGEVKSFTTTVLYTPGDTMTDQEGTKYPTIIILGKRWMAANLRTSTYSDGSPITNAKTNTEWSNQVNGAWCNYDNAPTNNKIYGKLYNWYTTTGLKDLCPAGWKVPSDADWDNLIAYLGDVSKAGLKMRTTGTSLWNAPNEGATNSSGFSGVPGGNRGDFGAFAFKGAAAFFWTSDQQNATYAKFRALNGNLSTVTDGYDRKKIGMSVRCVEQ